LRQDGIPNIQVPTKVRVPHFWPVLPEVGIFPDDLQDAEIQSNRGRAALQRRVKLYYYDSFPSIVKH
jgi:hypothetical protein